VLLVPVEKGWEPLIKSLDKFSDDFISGRREPETQEREIR